MDSGNFAWSIAATALVLFMTPGVAFFYGGLVKAKSVVSMMMLSFGAMGLVAVLWILYGFNMAGIAERESWGFEFSGNPFTENFALAGYTSSELVGATFGATFAIITVALISGAIADRAKFGSWLLFAGLWATIVYFPVAAWVWGAGGWIFNLGAAFGFDYSTIDYAGGTAVHINAGAAALALALVLGKRVGFQKGIQKPHNVPLVMLGAAILWFGWFGFNAGSAFAADGVAGLAWVNTTTATASAILGWLLTERIRDGKATSLGAASGAVAGLVAITPAAGALSPVGSIALGVVAGVLSALAVGLKFKFGYDDSLDVVGVHLVSGLWGTIAIGFLATDTGLFYGGDYKQLIVQIVIALVALVFTAIVTTVIAFALKPLGWRISPEEEARGIDESEHAESAYDFVSALR